MSRVGLTRVAPLCGGERPRWRMGVLEASDDELVKLTATGDRAAFTRLVARHQRRLLALVSRSLGSRAAAEDVVQDVFTRAWVNAPSWQPRETGGAGYAAWLSRVAVNLSVDQMRRRRSVQLDDVEDPVDLAPSAEGLLVAQENARRVRAAVARLSERQRTAVALTYDAELSNAEGAAAMGISVGAFELLLVRARKALRLSLRDGTN